MGKFYLGREAELFIPLRYLSIQKKFTFIDLFSGIGGFRIPLEDLGGKCLGYSEIDGGCLKVYQKNFISYLNQDELNLGDVQSLSLLPFEIDLIVGGVPCQPWSIAGKIKGFDDPRGKLWFDVIRIVIENKPKGFIFENVKGLTEPRNQKSFEFILKSFQNAGYTVKAQILNSYDFGLSQDRDRVFIVGIQEELERNKPFQFPQPIGTKPKLYQFVEGIQPQEIQKKKFPPEILFNGKIPASRGRFQKNDELNDFFTFADIRDGHTTIHSWDLIKTSEREKLICQVILKNRRKKKYGSKDGNPLSLDVLAELIPNLNFQEIEKLVSKKILRFIDKKGYDFVNSKISTGINGVSKVYLPHSDVIATLTATGTKDFIAQKSIACQEPREYKKTFIREIYRQRKFKPLSAQDYARLQGFPDWFLMAEDENTAKQQFGNAVSVPVVYHLAKELLKVILNKTNDQNFRVNAV
ncbi:MAG: DNA cytosine methyltransferase [Lyngbya sp.]|nr:DNA cytosine methyltransferase [Lyngbya sp.]